MRELWQFLSGRKTCQRIVLNRVLQEELPQLQGNVLEVGGSGEAHRQMATGAQRFVITNLDTDRPCVDEKQDVYQMSYEDNTWDAVVSVDMLEHLTHPHKALAEMCRVLKPGGTLFLVAPFMYRYHQSPIDCYRFTHTGLSVLMEDVGFEPVRFRKIGNRFTLLTLMFHKKKYTRWLMLPFYSLAVNPQTTDHFTGNYLAIGRKKA